MPQQYCYKFEWSDRVYYIYSASRKNAVETFAQDLGFYPNDQVTITRLPF